MLLRMTSNTESDPTIYPQTDYEGDDSKDRNAKEIKSILWQLSVVIFLAVVFVRNEIIFSYDSQLL